MGGRCNSPERIVRDTTATLSDPHWFADTLNVEAGFIEFVHTDRAALSDAPFLDERFSRDLTRRVRLPIDRLLKMSGLAPPKMPFVFHTSFCCSTLLARALDYPDRNLSLKEPKVLIDLADARRVSMRLRNEPHIWPALTNSILSVLSRRFDPNESILVKPTNLVNNLIPDIVSSGSPILLLYSDLRSFLVSVIKGGEGRRAFVRSAFNKLRLDPEPLGGIPDHQATEFTDLQIATLVWRHQMEGFMKILRGPYGRPVRTLDCSVLLARPAATLTTVNKFFALGLPPDAIRSIASGPVFLVNSKNKDQNYNINQRATDTQRIETQYDDTLESILNWAQKLCLGVDVPSTIPNALELTTPAGSSSRRDAG